MSDKVKIRTKLLKFRNQMKPSEQLSKSRKIAEKLEDFAVFKKAQHVLFYYSHNGEVSTLELIENFIEAKQLYLPIIRGKSHFQAIPLKPPLTLSKGFEGVPEPVGIEPSGVYDQQIELVITPGVAFDRKGNRLGMGKGYYDRYFQQNHSPLKIALAYEEQVLDSLPKDPYDVRIDFIITDKNIYKCH